MATRSTIAVVNADGTVSAVYCHWDGYVDYVGRMLVNNYNSFEAATELVSFGSISVLNVQCHPTAEHTFKKPQDGVTVFYARDRGEELVILKYETVNTYLHTNPWEEYNYIFMNNTWALVNEDDVFELVSDLIGENQC